MRIKTMWKRSVCFLGCLIKKSRGSTQATTAATATATAATTPLQEAEKINSQHLALKNR
jgi:hypothetical protein